MKSSGPHNLSQFGGRLRSARSVGFMDAYIHGIRSVPSSYAAASANWMTEGTMNNWFWSGSSVSANAGNAWHMNMATGNTNTNAKSNTVRVVCVR